MVAPDPLRGAHESAWRSAKCDHLAASTPMAICQPTETLSEADLAVTHLYWVNPSDGAQPQLSSTQRGSVAAASDLTVSRTYTRTPVPSLAYL